MAFDSGATFTVLQPRVPSTSVSAPHARVPSARRPPAGEQPSLASATGLCLSGGGFRAMLFHAGALWRLNEAGLPPSPGSRLERLGRVDHGRGAGSGVAGTRLLRRRRGSQPARAGDRSAAAVRVAHRRRSGGAPRAAAAGRDDKREADPQLPAAVRPGDARGPSRAAGLRVRRDQPPVRRPVAILAARGGRLARRQPRDTRHRSGVRGGVLLRLPAGALAGPDQASPPAHSSTAGTRKSTHPPSPPASCSPTAACTTTSASKPCGRPVARS